MPFLPLQVSPNTTLELSTRRSDQPAGESHPAHRQHRCSAGDRPGMAQPGERGEQGSLLPAGASAAQRSPLLPGVKSQLRFFLPGGFALQTSVPPWGLGAEPWGSPISPGRSFAPEGPQPSQTGQCRALPCLIYIKMQQTDGSRGGAESIELACSPAGHLFVNLIKGKWLSLSSSCSLSTREPILCRGGGSAASPGGCRQSAGVLQGQPPHPWLQLRCPRAGHTHAPAHKHIHPLPGKGHRGAASEALGVGSARGMSGTRAH